MPKRAYEDSDEEKWEKKLKKYQKKLERKRKKRRVLIHSDSEDSIIDMKENDKENEQGYSQPVEMTPDEVPSSDEPVFNVPVPASQISEPVIDAEFLQALGDDHIESPEWGADISKHLSERWEPIFKSGMKKELKEELTKKYLFPKNSPSCKPPLLNPEISSILTDASRNRDNRIATKQEQLGRALAALGKAMSGLMEKSMDSPQVLKVLNDVGKFVADSHFLETETRRTLIMPLLDKSFLEPIKDRKRDNYLFGDQLKDFIKSSRGIKKSGQLITPPQTSHLNWKNPSTSQQRAHRPNRFPQGRGAGNSRAQWNGRRRTQYQLPPPAQSQQPAMNASTTRRQGAPPTSANYRAPPVPSTSRPRNPTK